MRNLLAFLENDGEWETKLKAAPYNLLIKREGSFIIFSYNQLESDFHNPLVRECRGCIVEELRGDLEHNADRIARAYFPVCVPFYKFANYGESYADKIDWASARVQEKVDGSLIKLWYSHSLSKWQISTNGCVNADTTDLMLKTDRFKYFGDLVRYCFEKQGFTFDHLDKLNTYMLELTTVQNRVVVPYTEDKIWHIGTRSNITFQELEVDIGLPKPKTYPLTSLDECVEVAKNMPFSQEGFVVVDKDYHRIKIKSPAYVAIHHLKDNGNVSHRRVLELVRKNEQEEFLSYFPEYTDIFDEVKSKLDFFLADLSKYINEAKDKFSTILGSVERENRKNYAIWASSTSYLGFLMAFYSDPSVSVESLTKELTTDKLLEVMDKANGSRAK